MKIKAPFTVQKKLYEIQKNASVRTISYTDMVEALTLFEKRVKRCGINIYDCKNIDVSLHARRFPISYKYMPVGTSFKAHKNRKTSTWIIDEIQRDNCNHCFVYTYDLNGKKCKFNP